MKKHIKIFHEHNGYNLGDWIPCAVCGTTAVDIHHIEPKGMGGRPNADTPDNLVALCRKHHEQAHANIISKEYLKSKININEKQLETWKY